jgi:MFS family permease
MTPMILLLLLGGVIADRLPRRTVMVSADLLRCASQAVLAVLLLTGHGTLPAMVVLAALLGIGNAFYIPGRNGLVPQVASAANLQSANALSGIAQSAGALLGPFAGGLLVAGAGAGWAIAIDSASYALGALLLLSVRVRVTAGARPATRMIDELAAGWIEFTRRLWVWLVVVQFSLFFLLVYGPMQVLGALGFAHVPGGALRWGGLLSMLGAGAVAGGLLALRLRPERPIQASLLLFLLYAPVPASLAAHWPYAVQSGCFLLGGFSLAVFNVLWETTLQRVIPPELLSRVSAYDVFGSLCLLPLGYVVAGPMSELLGVAGALWLGAGYTLLSTLAVLLPAQVRRAGRLAGGTG